MSAQQKSSSMLATSGRRLLLVQTVMAAACVWFGLIMHAQPAAWIAGLLLLPAALLLPGAIQRQLLRWSLLLLPVAGSVLVLQWGLDTSLATPTAALLAAAIVVLIGRRL